MAMFRLKEEWPTFWELRPLDTQKQKQNKMQEQDILHLISPKLSHQVLYLLQEGCFGICSGRVKLTDLNTRWILILIFVLYVFAINLGFTCLLLVLQVKLHMLCYISYMVIRQEYSYIFHCFLVVFKAGGVFLVVFKAGGSIGSSIGNIEVIPSWRRTIIHRPSHIWPKIYISAHSGSFWTYYYSLVTLVTILYSSMFHDFNIINMYSGHI
jgi:hypothetical protein